MLKCKRTPSVRRTCARGICNWPRIAGWPPIPAPSAPWSPSSGPGAGPMSFSSPSPAGRPGTIRSRPPPKT